MQSDILFDNIYIGHSEADAAKLRIETFDVKKAVEKTEDETTKPKPASSPKSPMDLNFKDDPVLYVREKWGLFLTIAKRDPIEAARFVPEVAVGLGALLVSVLAMIVGAISMSSAPPPQVKKAVEKVKDNATAAKDKVVDAAASGVQAAQAEVNKRTTRSSAAAE